MYQDCIWSKNSTTYIIYNNLLVLDSKSHKQEFDNRFLKLLVSDSKAYKQELTLDTFHFSITSPTPSRR